MSNNLTVAARNANFSSANGRVLKTQQSLERKKRELNGV